MSLRVQFPPSEGGGRNLIMFSQSCLVIPKQWCEEVLPVCVCVLQKWQVLAGGNEDINHSGGQLAEWPTCRVPRDCPLQLPVPNHLAH